MSAVNELYQELILDHNKSPRNFKKPDHANKVMEGYNPLCGDHYTLYLEMDGDVIKEIGFEGAGCAISKASASLMTSAVKGMTKEEAEKLIGEFRTVITRDLQKDYDPQIEALGSLGAMAGVAEYPARIKCANLAWHALHGALNEIDNKIVSSDGENK